MKVLIADDERLSRRPLGDRQNGPASRLASRRWPSEKGTSPMASNELSITESTLALAPSQDQALARETDPDALAQIAVAAEPESSQAPLDEFLTYLRAVRNVSPHTIRSYTGDISQFQAFLEREGKPDILAARPADVRSFALHLRKGGSSPSTIKRRLSCVRSFYRFLERAERIASNPAVGVRGPKAAKRLPIFPDEAETARLVTTPDSRTAIGKRDRALLELMYSTGARITEVARLDIGDLDLRAGEVQLIGKGDRPRTGFLGGPSVRALRRYLGARRQVTTVEHHARRALWLGRYGTRLTTRQIRRIFKQYVKRVGLDPRISPHSLRHAMATHMINRGCPTIYLQSIG